MSITGTFIYILIMAILSIAFINSYSYILLLFSLILLIFVTKKYGFKMLGILLGVFIFFSFYRVNKVVELNKNEIESTFIIKQARPSYLIVEEDDVNYLVYYDEQALYEGQEIYIKGNAIKLEKDLDLDVFDFTEYLYNKRIYYQIEYEKLYVTNSEVTTSLKIKRLLTSRLTDESLSMTNMLMFNDKYADIDSYENLKEINALHLFVVSGFHISFFFSLIVRLFRKKEKVGTVVGFIICFIYVFILGFSISSIRALLSLFITKVFKDKLSKLDSISIPGILFLLIEPLNIYNYSFIMTFVMSYTIAFISSFLKNKSKIIQAIITSVFCFISMIPLQLLLNYKINFISMISNIILSYVVMVIFVCCLIGMLLSFLNGNLFGKLYSLFNDLIERISLLNTSIVLGSVSSWMIFAFYGILILLIIALENKRYKKAGALFISIILSLILLYNRQYLTPYQQVTFLNVYQGDCCIIQDSFSNKVMLIDTGGLKNYDIASKKIMPYLNYHGIRKIDIVVISHDDYDHCGSLDSLKEQIQIDTIIDDPSIKEISLGKIELVNLNKYYNLASNENEKSMVLYGNICNYNFLFTGDATTKIENLIIKDNQDLDVDVLKVGHHGSKTSTSKEFVNYITPIYSIISVGKNYYGHPNEEVIKRLEQEGSLIYRTDTKGATRFKGPIFNKTIVESAR